MSEHDSVTSAASSARNGDNTPKRAATLTDLVKKLHGKLGHADALSLTDHLKAAKLLCSIRNRLANDEEVDSKTLILLLCSGIACYRRWSVGDSGETTAGASAKNEADELKMNEEAKELVHSTATRIFILLCAAERQKGRRGDDAVAASREAVATAGLSSVWAQIAPPPPKKKKAKRADGGTERADDEPEDDRREEPSWSIATHLTAGEVARHALVLGVNCLEDEAYTAIDALIGLFYRSAGANMGSNAHALWKSGLHFSCNGEANGGAQGRRAHQAIGGAVDRGRERGRAVGAPCLIRTKPCLKRTPVHVRVCRS